MTATTQSHTLRRAWICVILIPVGIVLAFIMGETLPGLMGYGWTHEETMSLAPTVLVGGLALVLFCLPGILAGWFGLRARAAGEPNGLAPAIIGFVAAGYFLLISVLGLIGTQL